jgi:hypothetical protein
LSRAFRQTASDESDHDAHAAGSDKQQQDFARLTRPDKEHKVQKNEKARAASRSDPPTVYGFAERLPSEGVQCGGEQAEGTAYRCTC